MQSGRELVQRILDFVQLFQYPRPLCLALAPGQHLIHGTLAITAEVEGDVGEAEPFEDGRDAVAHFQTEGLLHLTTSNLDARHLGVMADAELAEAEGFEFLFGLFDLADVLGRDGRAVGMRELRQAAAGRSQVGSPARRDSSRISALVRPASTRGALTPCCWAAPWPGR